VGPTRPDALLDDAPPSHPDASMHRMMLQTVPPVRSHFGRVIVPPSHH